MFISINGVKGWEFETRHDIRESGGYNLYEGTELVQVMENEGAIKRFINDVNNHRDSMIERFNTLKESNFALAQDVKDACEELGKANARIRELEKGLEKNG